MCFEPADVLQRRQHAVDCDPAAAAQVDDLADHVRRCGLDGSIHRVRNECELPRLLTVAVDLDLMTLDQRVHESHEGHVGPLARSIDGEVAQRGRGDAEVPQVDEGEVLGRKLGHSVGGDRPRQCGLLGREHLGVAVDRRAGRKDQALDRHLAQGLEQALRRDDVVLHVAVEVAAPAGANPGLARQMKDDLRAPKRFREVGRDEVELLEREAAVAAQRLQVLLLAAALVVVAERVDADHLVSISQEPLAEMRADEPGRAGHHDTRRSFEHRTTLSS